MDHPVGSFGVVEEEACVFQSAEESAGAVEEVVVGIGSHGEPDRGRERLADDAFEDDEGIGDVTEPAFFHEQEGPGGGDVADDEFPGIGIGAACAGAAADFVDVAVPVAAEGAFDDDGYGSAGEDDFAGEDVAGGAAFEGFELVGREFLEEDWPGGLPILFGDIEPASWGKAKGELGLLEEVTLPVLTADAAEVAILVEGSCQELSPDDRGAGVGGWQRSAGSELSPGAVEIGMCGVR